LVPAIEIAGVFHVPPTSSSLALRVTVDALSAALDW
jgi:hypothetical protein